MKLIRGCFQFQLCLPFALRRINLWRVGKEVGRREDPVGVIGPYKLGWEEPGHVTRALLVLDQSTFDRFEPRLSAAPH